MQARNNIFDKQNFTNIDGALKNITHNITDSNLILPFLQNVLRRFKIDNLSFVLCAVTIEFECRATQR